MLRLSLQNIRKLFIINNEYKALTNKFCSTALREESPLDSTDKDDVEKKLKILALEVDVLRQEGKKAPDPISLKKQHWDHLLKLNSRSARRKYYSFLWQIEKKNENILVKKQQKQEEIAERRAQRQECDTENDHIVYGLAHNTIFLRIYETTINLWHNNKLMNAVKFGQNLVFDCSYDKNMNEREAMNAAKQLMLCFAENRNNDEPFNLHYCNANPKSYTMQKLNNYIPPMNETWFPMNVHENSYMDLFPKERLVYLTPHCRNELDEFSHEDIYIIGAMVDKVNNEPLSLAKAKSLGLRMAKLPLDRYLQWGAGSGKSLTLNQMVHILLEMKNTGDWRRALEIVPRRKIVQQHTQYDNFDSEKKRMNKYTFRIDKLEGFERKKRE